MEVEGSGHHQAQFRVQGWELWDSSLFSGSRAFSLISIRIELHELAVLALQRGGSQFLRSLAEALVLSGQKLICL